MTRAELETRAGQVLEGNWTGTYTMPSSPHYRDLFLWDSCFAAIINARRKEPQIAGVELQTLLQGIDRKTGFIPNRRLIGGPNWKDMEARLTFTNRSQSNYTQPPLFAHSAWEIYESFKRNGEHEKGKNFLQDIYGKSGQQKVSGLKGAYEYFTNYRENGDGSKLIGGIHPHETGRDSDPSVRPGAMQIPRHGIIANFDPKGALIPLANKALDFLTTARINVRGKFRQWDIKKMKENVYWVNDVMFNVLYVNSLRYMSKISNELGYDKETLYYNDLADVVEKEIRTKMWNDNDGFFYNLDKNGNQIPIASITGLSPITLEDISKEQLTSLLDKIESPEWFGTPYPLPSLPVNSPYYDPHYTERRLWRGPAWIITNHIIAEEGLVKQIERFQHDKKLSDRMINSLKRLVEKTEELPGKNDPVNFFEFYDPENGCGYRIKHFTCSVLALYFDKSNDLLNQARKEASVVS